MSARTVQLAEIAKIGAGQGAPQDPKAFTRDGHAFIRAGSLEKLDAGDSDCYLERLDEKSAANHAMRLYSPNTVVFAKSGMSATKNRVYILRKPAYIVNHLATIVPSEGLNAPYLRYWLEHFNPTRLIQDYAYPSISLAAIEAVTIPLPGLPEQRGIAKRLEEAGRLRRTRRYALEATEELLPALFIKLFGDPFGVPSAELARLEDVLEGDPQNGLYVPAGRYVENGDPKGTEMVHMSDLFGGIVTPGNLKRALLETSEVAKYQISELDLLIARRSLAYEGAAQPCRVPALQTPLVFESSMIRIRPDRSQILAVYLYYYLTNRAVRENRVRRYVTISTISGINQDNLCRIEVVVPPLTLQQKFATLVEQVERLRAVQREALRQADHLFASLLHQAFS